MVNENTNTFLMIMGVVLVLIIISYFVVPLYFDKYVLMNIPEYRRLSEVLDESKKSLDGFKSDIATYKGKRDKLRKLWGTEAGIVESDRKTVELEKRLESRKRELKQFTGVVATLKNQLKESTGDANECSKLQTAATKRMKELNDLLITEFVLEDKTLARRLQATRDSLLTLLTTSKDLLCENKSMAINMLAQGADTMRKHREETNRLCDFKTPAEDSPGINRLIRYPRDIVFTQKVCKKYNYQTDIYGNKAQVCQIWGQETRDFKPQIQRSLINLFDDIESTISYVLQNKFCSKDLTFRVDEFEKFVSKLINGLCESNDWKKVTGKQLDYILNKPATYL